jgi:WD40 repeat protein
MFRILIVLIGLSSILFLSSVNAQPDPTNLVRAMDWNSDSTLLAYSAGGTSCYDHDEEMTYDIQILDIATQEITKTITGTKCPIYSLDWSPDDTRVVTASGDALGIMVWSVSTGELVTTIKFGGQGVREARWSLDAQEIAFSSAGNFVGLMDPKTGDLIKTPRFGGTRLDWSSDGSRLITSSSYENSLYLIDRASTAFSTLYVGSEAITDVNWNPDDMKIAFGDVDGNVQIWNTELAQLDNVATPHTSAVTAVDWKPDSSQQIASASTDGTLVVWDALTGDEIYTTKNDTGIYDLAWSPDGTQLAYGNGSNVEIISAPEMQTVPTAMTSETPVPPFPGPSLTPAATASKTPVPPFPGPSLTPQR